MTQAVELPKKETVTIPQPKTFGPLGNLPQIDVEAPSQSFLQLSYEYGGIFKVALPGASNNVFISSPELVADACDESRFDKKVSAPLQIVRDFAGDGLFTSKTDEPNWQKAHNILLSSFSQRAMKGYHDMMVDIAVQLVQKWSRLNSEESIDVADDMTRLTLDTIGLCGFNYRFHSFYHEQPHPFISSMARSLQEAMAKVNRIPLQDKLMLGKKRQYKQDIQSMFRLVDKIIAEKKKQETLDGDDLLSHMLNSKDPQTGEKLDDENIRYQIITFLIAGHETTSGMLSFALHFLLKNPEKLQKVYAEVDHVLTGSVPTYKQVRELKYTRMILSEALRLWPTAPMFTLCAKKDTLLGGKYPMKKGHSVNVLIPKLHRDKSVWGEDVEEFRPERFEDPSQIPHDAYKPFGNGQRACIGQQFALHEATLVLGMILKQFEIVDHTDYQLKIKETLTLKPDGFTMRIRPRSSSQLATITLNQQAATIEEPPAKQKLPSNMEAHDTPLLALYGSNLGTAEGIARELADVARSQGFQSQVAPLDEYVGNLPKEGAVLIVTASYNGNPPDNAKAFVKWLEQAEPGAFEGVRYAVFGCGDRSWASTFQQVPRFIEEQLAKKGAIRLTGHGEGDASDDFEWQFEKWETQLWPDMIHALDLKIDENLNREQSSLTVQFVNGIDSTPLANTYGATVSTVVKNRELHKSGSDRSTRHIEVALPEGVSYREGDHLGVLPQNSVQLVERVLHRFRLNRGDQLILSSTSSSLSHLPMDKPVSVSDLLTHCVELQEPVTRAQIRELAACTVCPPHKIELEALLQDDTYKMEVLHKRVSILDLLEKYLACELPFKKFLGLLPPLKARYYSISSSPGVLSDRVSLTVSVVRGPAWSGSGEYRGVASNYLAERQPGDKITMFVRTPDSGFQLPEDLGTPIIMVGPGTGIAPFRGFLQARRVHKQKKHKLGEAHLYFGCRNPENDYLYREELEDYESDGLVALHTAFSRVKGEPKTYVQHVMEKNANELIRLLDQGGRLYVCGDGVQMAPDVEETLKTGYCTVYDVNRQDAKDWLENLQREGRYAKDVWSG